MNSFPWIPWCFRRELNKYHLNYFFLRQIIDPVTVHPRILSSFSNVHRSKPRLLILFITILHLVSTGNKWHQPWYQPPFLIFTRSNAYQTPIPNTESFNSGSSLRKELNNWSIQRRRFQHCVVASSKENSEWRYLLFSTFQELGRVDARKFLHYPRLGIKYSVGTWVVSH